MTYNEVVEKIKNKVVGYSHFKIGKTEKDLETRYNEAYKNDYDKLIKICHSTHSATITNWEKSLLDDFIHNEEYAGICDNKTDFDGIMARSKDYHIYVAVKK